MELFSIRIQRTFQLVSTHVKIRPSYHERIREITRVIGRGDVTITAYVDKVLKAHLDDNRETIERLFEEREAVASRQPKAEER